MLTYEDIKKMNYTDFIALIRETNRCPGGKNTIRKVLLNTFINSSSKVIDVGSNTGFNTFEIARLTGAEVTGIDVSESCVKESIRELKQDSKEIIEKVNFLLGSAYNIPYDSLIFDLVFTGGATSFMDDKEKAINEYFRVAKDWGYVCMTPLVYIKDPPQSVLDDTGDAIGIKIEKMTTSDWIKLVEKMDDKNELFYFEECLFENNYHERLESYIDFFLSKPHIKALTKESIDAIREKWTNYLKIFIKNHEYLGFAILIFRKRRDVEEPELFKV